MANIIREAFQKVKIDITDLRDKAKKNENEFSKINENILIVKKDYKKNLDNVYDKLEEMLDYMKKENKELKRQLTILKKDGIKSEAKEKPKREKKEEPLYETEIEPIETGEEKGEKKKGWFSKLVDFLAEEDD